MASVIVAPDETEDVEFEAMGDVEEKAERRQVVRPQPKQKKTKGRGFRGFEEDQDDRYTGKGGQFESVADHESSEHQKSVEGWIVFISNVHEEAQEDDVYDMFVEYGEIKQVHLNLDRRTGYVKGYALVEYEHFKEAKAAIDNLNGATMLERKLGVSWAFKKSQRRARRPRRFRD